MSNVVDAVCVTVVEDRAAPSAFICPLSGRLMINPVVAADGWSYERDACEGLFAIEHEARSPMTGAAFAHTSLSPNHALRMRILEWSAGTCAANGSGDDAAVQAMGKGAPLTATAQYNFEGTGAEDELHFETGDVLTIVQTVICIYILHLYRILTEYFSKSYA